MEIEEERLFRNAAMAWLDAREKAGHKRIPYSELADFEHNGIRTLSMDSWNCPWADMRTARRWPIRTAQWRTRICP